MPMPRSPLVETALRRVVKRRDGLTDEEFDDLIRSSREEWEALGSDPWELEEILHNDFGLEPDYAFDLMAEFGIHI
jgi:hypothetical protein